MKVVLQRAFDANVKVANKIVGAIANGLLVLAGFGEDESPEEMQWVANKIINLRIFNDLNGVMNLSLKEVKGELLVVSQFTLMASTKKGNRPSYIEAAKPDRAKLYYETFINILEGNLGTSVQQGVFGANMMVDFTNVGPVTIIIDSKNRI